MGETAKVRTERRVDGHLVVREEQVDVDDLAGYVVIESMGPGRLVTLSVEEPE